MAPTPLNARDMAASLALGLVVPAQASEAPRVEPIIVVTGERSNQVALDRVPTSIVNTPQAITVLTSDELAKRGIANLSDALRNVAGLSLGAGETSFQGNNAVLRGFTTRNDMFVDNARDYGYYFRDTFDDDRIEVIKGPSSTLFGRGSTGGVIHRVGKMPHLETALASEARIGLDDTRAIIASHGWRTLNDGPYRTLRIVSGALALHFRFEGDAPPAGASRSLIDRTAAGGCSIFDPNTS